MKNNVQYECPNCDKVLIIPEAIEVVHSDCGTESWTCCVACGRQVLEMFHDAHEIDLTVPMIVMQSVDCQYLDSEDIPY